MSKIGEAKSVLSTAVREEFGVYREELDALCERAAELSSDCTGINGVSTFWRGLQQQLQSMSSAVREKEAEVIASLAGRPKHEIKTHVDGERAERVRMERMQAEREEAA